MKTNDKFSLVTGSRVNAISKRQFLGASAAALCGLGLASAPLRAAPGETRLKIGMATFRFTELTNAELAKELAGAGIHFIQLFLSQKDSRFWKYHEHPDVSSLTPARCKEIATIYRDAGITIDSIGVYPNLIHPDAIEQKANLDYFEAMMNIGAHMDVHTFISDAGYYDNPKSQEPKPKAPYHFQDDVWPRMIDRARELAAMAEKYEAKVLFEAWHKGFFASAKRVRVFLEEVNSQHLGALLDAANLIEVNDLEEMFSQLGPWIGCIHAKDRKLHNEGGVGAGKGDLDYPKFVKLAAQYTPTAPLILEYVGPTDYRAALDHLRGVLRQAGISEW